VSALVSTRNRSRRLPIVVLGALAIVAGVAAGRADAPAVARPVEPVDATQLPAADAVSTAWYCPGLPPAFPTKTQTYTLSNLGTSAARASVTVHPDDGSEPKSQTVTVPPGSVRSFDRSTLPAGPLVIEPFSPDVMLSAGVESADQLDVVPCATTAGADWYFAGGTTVRGVTQWLVLEDPFAGDARVDVTLRTDTGLQELPSLTGLDVPGRSRVVIPIHDEAVRRERVSIQVHAAVGRVVASQTIVYGSASGPPGVATAIGAVKSASSWWFVGDTRPGTTNVAIANVGQLDARVNVQAQAGPKTIVHPVQVTVPAGGVSWVQIGGCSDSAPGCLDVPGQTGYVLLVQSDADAPIVAQTLNRFDGGDGGAHGAATSVGSSTPARQWVIPRTRVLGERLTTIALSDPGLKPAHIAVTIARDGQVVRPESLQRLTVSPGARFLLPLSGLRVLSQVDAAITITSDVPIFAESTIYSESDATRGPGIPRR
jgi:hypothetical protein